MAAMKNNPNSYQLNALMSGLAEHAVADDCGVSGLSLNSKEIQAGDLFIACAGTQKHGLCYAEKAVENGAVAIAYEMLSEEALQGSLGKVLVRLESMSIPLVAVRELNTKVGMIAERFYANPSHDLYVIGITGTNGKTSCSHFLANLLSSDETPCGVIGTLGNGAYGDLQEGTHTTPDAISLHKLFSDMRDNGLQHVSMEVSSHGIEQGRVGSVGFDVAVFTNLSRDHLDYHGDMENYARSKRRLFEQPGLRYAVVNADDNFGRDLLESLPDTVQSVAYSLSDEGNAEASELRNSLMHLGCVQGSDLHFTPKGMSMQISSPWGEGELHSHLYGRFNASNLLAVLAAALLSGMRLSEALDGIAKLLSVAGRMQHIEAVAGQSLVVVDYAHTPDALEHALEALRVHCDGQLWCVFGCGGDRDRGKRPLMGGIAEKFADQIVLTDDNPRSENAVKIIDDIRAGMHDMEKLHVENDRRKAIAYAIEHANSNDVILLAGKGHEAYQLIGTERLAFNDADVATELLGAAQ